MNDDITGRPTGAAGARRRSVATGLDATRRRAAGFGAAICLATTSGCGTEPPVRLYSLQSPDSAAPAEAHLRTVSINLAPITVPAQVDQPEWLIRTPDDSLRLLEQNRWAAPLRSELRAALLDTLQSRWAASDTQLAPVAGGAAVWRVVVDVQRFESLPGLEARLEARWRVASLKETASAPASASITCHGQWREPATGEVAALAAAHRGNVRKLADAIGSGLQAVASGTPASCGGVADATAAF